MSTGPVATATVRIVPDTTGFRALLEAEVAAATKGVSATVGASLASTAAAGTSATTALKKVGGAGKIAAEGASAAEKESQALRGAMIGLSRVTPVTVFGLGVYGSAAIAAGLALKSAIKSTADLEHELNIFQVTTGATAEEMKKVHDEAKALGGDLTLPATSAGDAASAMTELAKAGLSVDQTLKAARGTLQLAAAAQIDVGTAADFVATELNAFGLSGDQATHVADLLAGASIAAQGDIRDFGTAFQQVSAVARQTGLSLEQTTGALTELAKAGLRGADGGTSLRTTLLRLTPTTKQAAEFQDALGIKLDQTKSIGQQLGNVLDQYKQRLAVLTPIQRQQVLSQIAGQDAIRALSILIREGSKGLEENTRAANQNGAALRLAEGNARGLSGSFSGLKNNLDTLGITLGELVKGPLTAYVNEMAQAVDLTTRLANAAIRASGHLGFLGKIPRPGLGNVPLFGPLLQSIQNVNDATKNKPSDEELSTQQAQRDEPVHGTANLANERNSGVASKILPALTKEQIAREKAAVAALIARRRIAKANKDITAPLPLQNAQLQSQLNGSLQAQLKADQAIEDYFANRLKSAKEGTARYTKILAAEVSAHAATQSIQDQIDSNAKQARQAALEKAKKEAEDAKAHRLALFNLEKSRLDLAIQAAGLTKTKADDIRTNRAEIAFFQAQIKRIEAIKKRRKLTLDEQQALVDYQSSILSLRATIQDLKKKDKKDKGDGFTLEDLFKESVNQLNEFGSNVSTGVTLGGGARAALAGAISAQNPHLSPADRAKLLATGRTNDLLAEILAEISAQNPAKKPPRKPPTTRDQGGGASYATDARSRGFTAAVRGGPH